MSATAASIGKDHLTALKPGPLSGLCVVDFTRVLSGPFSTALLADLGAEVIKVESPEGDDYRHIGPFIDGTSVLFAFANRGKKSVVLNLKDPQDRARAVSLADVADVVVENFRPGVAERLGIGHLTLRARNERLIYASISGFGQVSPSRELPAFDLVVQALTGLMSINGSPDGPPMMVGEAFGDLAAGLFASWAILAAVVQRNTTGKGCYIDVAMFDSLLSLMPTAVASCVATGKAPMRAGNRHPLSAPFGAFAAQDGDVVIAVLSNRHFAILASLIGSPDLPLDERYISDESRCKNEASLRVAIEDWTRSLPVTQVIATLEAAGIPCSAIHDVAHAVDSEQSKARKVLRPGKASGVDMVLPDQPVHFSTLARGQASTAPALGEHNGLLSRMTQE